MELAKTLDLNRKQVWQTQRNQAHRDTLGGLLLPLCLGHCLCPAQSYSESSGYHSPANTMTKQMDKLCLLFWYFGTVAGGKRAAKRSLSAQIKGAFLITGDPPDSLWFAPGLALWARRCVTLLTLHPVHTYPVCVCVCMCWQRWALPICCLFKGQSLMMNACPGTYLPCPLSHPKTLPLLPPLRSPGQTLASCKTMQAPQKPEFPDERS